MRALRLCGLTLAVVTAHLIAWRIAAAGWVPLAFARAGVRWIVLGAAVPRDVAAAVPATRPPLVPAAAPPPSPPSLQALAEAAVPARMPTPRTASPAVPTTSTPSTPAARTRTAAAPRAGDGGTARRVEALAPPLATYPTRAPPTTSMRYVLVQADAHAPAPARGTATLDWQHHATSFSLRVAFDALRAPPREWVSTGGFDAAGVAPLRLAERERGRDKRAVNFDRDAGRVRFSGTTQALPLAPGTQDRWSWVAQLAAIAEAASTADARRRPAARAPARRIPAGTTWTIAVAGLRGEMARWVFRVLPDATLPPEAGPQRNDSSDEEARAPALLHLLREPERPYDLRIEAWLSPALHHLPVGLRMSTPPGSWSVALWPAADGADP